MDQTRQTITPSLLDCPYCHLSGGREVRLSPRTVVCDRCGLYRQVPRMSRDEQIAYFAQLTGRIDLDADWGAPSSQLRVCQWELNLIERTFPGLLHGGRLLDVGAGSGYFAYAAAKVGAKATGLEPVPELVAYGRGHGIDLRCGRFEPEGIPKDLEQERFDLVCLRECLCCFPDLRATFELARSLLASGGRIYIKSHNAASYSYVRERASYGDRMGRFGSALPTCQALTYILEREHFRVVHIGYYPFSDPISDLGWARLGRSIPGRIVNKLLQPLLSITGRNDRLVLLASSR